MSAFLLIGTIVLGFAMAGMVMLGYRLVGRKAPRWLPPAVGGATMLAFHILMEQTWFERVSGQLSDRVEVIETFRRQAWWQPWTLVQPQVVRFIAVDGASVESVAGDRARADVWFVDRFQGSAKVEQLYDCTEPRRADLFAEAGIDAEGAPVGAPWVEVAADDPIRQAVCERAGREPSD